MELIAGYRSSGQSGMFEIITTNHKIVQGVTMAATGERSIQVKIDGKRSEKLKDRILEIELHILNGY